MLCAVLGCNNSYNYKGRNSKIKQKVRFLGFPKDPKLRKQWVIFCGRMDNFITNSSRICAEHFTNDDYKSSAFLEQYGLPVNKRLKPNTVPSVKLLCRQNQTDKVRIQRLAKKPTTYQPNFTIQEVHSSTISSSSFQTYQV